jgi:hypothetical protein
MTAMTRASSLEEVNYRLFLSSERALHNKKAENIRLY